MGSGGETAVKTSNHKASIKMNGDIIPSGFPAYQREMVSAFLFFAALYFGTIATFDKIQSFLQLPPSAPELCQEQNSEGDHSPCWRSDLFAFEVVSGIALAWCGVRGFWAWHVQRVDRQIPSTPHGRLFEYIPAAHELTALGTTFQIFDLFISLLIPEQRVPLFLCHHVMAATVSWYGLNNQYFHYYGIFYLGCSEVSTIPLVFLDLAKFFPPQPDTRFEHFVNGLCGPAFAVTFTFYRVIQWWIVGYQMFSDIFAVMKDGSANKLRPGRNHVLYVMMALNLLLGLLQLYWFQIILGEAAKVLGFENASDAKEEL